MNLLTAVVGVGIGALGITTLTGFVDLQSTTPILAVMLGLAVGIDYALFIVTRFRHELQEGRSVPDAAAMAVGTAGSAVVTAGVTVVIALAGLAVAGIPFLTEMGLAAAATIVVAVLVAITLVPAVLGFVGVRALPRRLRRGTGTRAVAAGPAPAAGKGFFAGWARTVTRRRWASLLVAVLALSVVAIPVFAMRTTLIQPSADDSTQARATQILSERFGAGFTGPLLILVEGDDAATRAAAITRQAPAVPGVAVATPPQATADGSAALMTIIPRSSPSSDETVELVHDLRDTFGDADGVAVTGGTAVSVDVSQKLDQALPIYLVLVVGLALVLLILVFRSILVPVAGVLGFLLTIGASLGATTAVFQWGWLRQVVQADATGPLLSLMPIIVIGILFGLAMDYQVFLVSRMHENHAHGAAPRDAVVTGFRQAAPVVIAAACIMFAVFAGFVPEGDATLKPIAFALALGILFDAVIIRMVAMPAALALLGRSAWWLPRWLSWLPVLDVEGAALERRVAHGELDRAEEPVAAGAR
jgi:RND superfamily putative drug exporter